MRLGSAYSVNILLVDHMSSSKLEISIRISKSTTTQPNITVGKVEKMTDCWNNRYYDIRRLDPAALVVRCLGAEFRRSLCGTRGAEPEVVQVGAEIRGTGGAELEIVGKVLVRDDAVAEAGPEFRKSAVITAPDPVFCTGRNENNLVLHAQNSCGQRRYVFCYSRM